MKTLLLDSSQKNLSVGIAVDGKIVGKTEYDAWQKQSEFMVKEIKDLLVSNGIEPTSLDAVVSSKGPGSYTGIRIALTIAKTISFALQIPLYLASSLEVLRCGNERSVVLMNARSKRSYFAVYEGKKVIEEDSIRENAEVLAYLSAHPECKVCGDLGYLGLESAPFDRFSNLLDCLDEAHLCEEPLGAKPVYLKDDYDQGKFKTIVRKSMPSDVPAIMELEKSFAHPYTEKQILYELTENPVAHLYSATVDGVVVGFLDFYITFDSSSIVQIVVKEEFRNKGIGNMLLGQMLKDLASQADPVSFITLEVRKSNENAQRFYKKHKFEAVTVKKAYYEDGEDAIYMVRSL